MTFGIRTVSPSAPQGCVLSPMLFSLLTNDCSSRNPAIKAKEWNSIWASCFLGFLSLDEPAHILYTYPKSSLSVRWESGGSCQRCDGGCPKAGLCEGCQVVPLKPAVRDISPVSTSSSTVQFSTAWHAIILFPLTKVVDGAKITNLYHIIFWHPSIGPPTHWHHTKLVELDTVVPWLWAGKKLFKCCFRTVKL